VKPPPFDHVAPGTLEEALATLAAGGPDAKLIAGGQSLIPLLAFRLLRPALLVDLNRVPGLASVRPLEDGGLAVGAMTRTHELECSALVAERWPLARAAAPQIGHRQIRNRGTVGGSIVHADPAAELPAVALASGATLHVIGPEGARAIPAAAFFLTVFTTAIAADEVLTEIRVPAPVPGVGSAVVELSRRRGDFALAGAAATVTLEDGVCTDASLVMFGLGATPVAVPAAAEALRGTVVDEAQAREAAAEVAGVIDPGSDAHGSAAYRRELAPVVARRALLEAAGRSGRSEDSGHH
jgi:CO/xanthine dehydrogenase FAD-binding subunit